MMINGSPYLANGTPQRCALCNASFMAEDEHIKWLGGKRPLVLLLSRAR
jgi:hypothetical protein